LSVTALYTPDVLALATGLAAFPLDDALPLKGEARSKSCGSVISLGLALDEAGRIGQVGVRAQACAVGQAAAAIFARSAPGRDARDVRAATDAMAAWLAGEGPLPDWPGLDAIAKVKHYPARHAAVMLAWKAAQELLSSSDLPR